MIVEAQSMPSLLALLATFGSAQAFDDPKYPDLKGRWERFVVPEATGQPAFDQTKS